MTVVTIEPEVVARARRGDPAACREIVERLHRPVIATIFRFLGSRHAQDLEDIAQDVFLKIFRSLDRFDPARGVKFSTWIYTFVRNHCFDVLKKRRIKTTSLHDGEGASLEPPDPAAPSPLRAAQASELGGKIEEALQSLEDDQRMVFVLREYEGLDYGAIAEVLDLNEGTVKSRLFRAREALRAKLGRYASESG
jgi:RNA polymerase sigma-70 factor (ECF subfamily)